MSPVALKRLGSIDLADLDVINSFVGRDFLPHPFLRCNPTPFATGDDYRAYARSVTERYQHGDLQLLRRWFSSYVDADIRVECSVQHIPADTHGVQVVAHRQAESGYVATQRPDEDVIDVSTLSPYELGAATAEAVELTTPGQHSEIAIPEFAPPPERGSESAAVSIRHNVVTASAVTVPRAEITVFSLVQSHWQPARRWGPDPNKSMLVWGRINDDGDYISVPDSANRAKPMTRAELAKRIDRLIAEDVVKVRESRRR